MSYRFASCRSSRAKATLKPRRPWLPRERLRAEALVAVTSPANGAYPAARKLGLRSRGLPLPSDGGHRCCRESSSLMGKAAQAFSRSHPVIITSMVREMKGSGVDSRADAVIPSCVLCAELRLSGNLLNSHHCSTRPAREGPIPRGQPHLPLWLSLIPFVTGWRARIIRPRAGRLSEPFAAVGDLISF